VREQLLNLLELQACDLKVRELDIAAKQLPAKLDPLRRDLAKLQGMIDAERAKLSETETWRKAQQELLDREREALKNAQNKLQASKNTKEFSAANREVENKRKSITDRETELKKVVEASNTQSTQLTERDAVVQKLRDELTASEAAMADEVNVLETNLAEAKTMRDTARGKVEKSWVKTYDSLSAKRGYAVAPVIKGTCQGCHMALPPQLNNILARMQSIEMCPRCGRIVYRIEMTQPKTEDAAKPADAPQTDAAAKPEGT
jgi:predicted  nucleic acid-binding Zn-ribbon protein